MRFSRRFVPVIVTAEALIGVAVLVPAARPPALAAAGVLLLAFAFIAFRSATGAAVVNCACFGPHGGRLGWPHVLRNLLLVAFVGTAVPSQSAGWTPSAAVMPAVALAVGCAVLGALMLDRVLTVFNTSVS